MQILYRFPYKDLDITHLLPSTNGIITIPAGDHERYVLLADLKLPLHKKKNRKPKSIIVTTDKNITEIKHDESAFIDIESQLIYFNISGLTYPTKIQKHQKTYNKSVQKKIKDRQNNINKLTDIQNTLTVEYGDFTQEYPEQLMAVTYLTGNEKVLEIGGNIGRNSLIIGKILNNNNNGTNMVTMEPSLEYVNKLKENRDNNNLTFHIENSAISKRKLIQKDSDTIESDVLLDGYFPINIISWEELKDKYHIDFDTLIIDCEGAFYYILMDTPEILNNIKLIIMENDYIDLKHKKYVDNVLNKRGFKVDYREAGGWGECFAKFYEVWTKN